MGMSTRRTMPSCCCRACRRLRRDRGGVPDRHRHHKDELEHRADEDDEQLMRLADPRPWGDLPVVASGALESRPGGEIPSAVRMQAL